MPLARDQIAVDLDGNVSDGDSQVLQQIGDGGLRLQCVKLVIDSDVQSVET